MTHPRVLLDLQTTTTNLDHARQLLEMMASYPEEKRAFGPNSLEYASFMASGFVREQRRLAKEIDCIKLTLLGMASQPQAVAETLRTIKPQDIVVRAICYPDGRVETQTFAEIQNG